MTPDNEKVEINKNPLTILANNSFIPKQSRIVRIADIL